MKKIMKRILAFVVAISIIIPFVKVNADSNTHIFILEDGTNVNSIIGADDYVLEVFVEKGILAFDEQTGRMTNSQTQKLLFTINDSIITLADNVSSADNLEYAFTDEEKTLLEETPLQGFDKVILSFSVYYNVSFETNGGSAVPQQTVFKNLTAEEPEDPEKADYIFVGWYSNEGLTTPFSFNTPITQDITIYAKWEKGASLTLETGINANSLIGIDDYILDVFFAKGILTLDEQTGRITNSQTQKLLFTINDSIITLADNVSSADNLEYAFTDEEKTLLEETPLQGFDKVILKFKSQSQNKEYTLTSGNNSVIFDFESGHTFQLKFTDMLKMTLAELSEYNLDENSFAEKKAIIINNVKKYGTLLGVYVIEIDDGNIGYSDEVKIKIKLTDEMKEYNTFKFIYLDENNNFKVGDIVDLKVEGEYLTGTLPHLSVYGLVGSTTETTTTNPKTGDNIISSVIMLVISFGGLTGSVL